MIDSPAPSLPGAQGDATNTGCANQVLTYITFVLIFGQLMHFEYVIHSQHLGLKESRRIWGRSLPLLYSAGSQLLPRVASLLCISPDSILQAVGDIRVPLSPQQQDTSGVIPPHHLSWSLFSSLSLGISTDSQHLGTRQAPQLQDGEPLGQRAVGMDSSVPLLLPDEHDDD